VANYVLVHGSWLGGWCWQRVTPLLSAAGHTVLAPSLTGLGDRSHLVGKTKLGAVIDLNLHIQDVGAWLEWEDLSDVILVGHSYAGMVITAVADRMPDRIAHLFYVDAVIPEDGKAIVDLIPPEMAASVRAAAAANDDPTRMPPAPPEALGITDPGDVAWVTAKSVGMPMATHEQQIELTGAYKNIAKRTYVACTDPVLGGLEATAAAARDDPDCNYFEIATGHDPMITKPRELAELLLAGA
jgi:pimeloyl-ACP methyl ester carboxylesterase